MTDIDGLRKGGSALVAVGVVLMFGSFLVQEFVTAGSFAVDSWPYNVSTKIQNTIFTFAGFLVIAGLGIVATTVLPMFTGKQGGL